MLLVKTELRASLIHGFGVFAAEFIPAGTRVWEYREGVDHRLSKEFVDGLPAIARDKVLHYSAFWGGGYVVSADDARFLNHSFSPNLITFPDPDIDVAIRDIAVGEELTEDYREFDDGRFSERGIRVAPDAELEAIVRTSHDDALILAALKDVRDRTRAETVAKCAEAAADFHMHWDRLWDSRTPPQPAPLSAGEPADGATLIAAERQRQKQAEGWTPGA